jgi:ABC-type multidrug transport system ATPase subunit
MLTKLTLRNFRGFENHELPLRLMTVIVGRNNAGKSTVVEALRLVSIVVARYRRLGFHPGPEWARAGRASVGVRPSLRNLEISLDGMFHHYNDPPAVIIAEFSEGQSVTIYIAAEDRFHAVIRGRNGRIVKTREKAIEANLPTVSIMPQIGPVLKKEVTLSEDYVRGAMYSALSSLHFRNQILFSSDDVFDEFCDLVEETWPGVSIHEFLVEGWKPGDSLYLEVRNEGFVGEVGLMGHGLQMWLQTMWFLTLSRDSETVILDEPDVYMHPDLQRRIIRLLRGRHKQSVITTHSVEILSEVDPDEILIVDKRRSQSQFASSAPAVQRLVDKVGSVHNISLARLWHARKLILVEGKDLTLLKALQNTLFPRSSQPIDTNPSMPIGGWGGWQYAVGSAMLLRNAVGEEITTYCILDSDYHTREEITQRYQQAQERNVQLHIWEQKEIENYLLSPEAIQRVVEKSLPRRASGPSSDEVYTKLIEISEAMKDDVIDGLATEILSRERKLVVGTANKRAREKLDCVTASQGSLLSLASGKTLISRLSDWSQSEFGVQLSSIKIVREMSVSEIPREVQQVLAAIEDHEAFDFNAATISSAVAPA